MPYSEGMDLNSDWSPEAEEIVPSTQHSTDMLPRVGLMSTQQLYGAHDNLGLRNQTPFAGPSINNPLTFAQSPMVHAPNEIGVLPGTFNPGTRAPPPPAGRHSGLGVSAIPSLPHQPPLHVPRPTQMHAFGSRATPIALSSDGHSVDGGSNHFSASQPSSMDEDHLPMPRQNIGGTGAGRSNWRNHEVIVLAEAKKEYDLKVLEGGLCRRLSDRWQTISASCQANGVYRSKVQCKGKWEKVQAVFNRIRDYERNIPSGWNSYWNMDSGERRMKGLPTEDFPLELYEKMLGLFGGDRNVEVAANVFDSQTSDAGGQGDNVATNGTLGGGTPVDGNPPPVEDGTSGGVRRKRRSRVSAGNISDLVDTTRRLVSVYEDAETSRTTRMAEAEERKEARDEERDRRVLELEEAKIRAMQSNTEALCKLQLLEPNC